MIRKLLFALLGAGAAHADAPILSIAGTLAQDAITTASKRSGILSHRC